MQDERQIHLDPTMTRFTGGRWRFVFGPGVHVTMDAEDETGDGWVGGTIVDPRSADDESWCWINLATVSKAVNQG